MRRNPMVPRDRPRQLLVIQHLWITMRDRFDLTRLRRRNDYGCVAGARRFVPRSRLRQSADVTYGLSIEPDTGDASMGVR